MAGKMRVLFMVFVSTMIFLVTITDAVPEPGIKMMYFNEGTRVHSFSKSLFKDAKIYIKGEYHSANKSTNKPVVLTLHWYLYVSECAQQFPKMAPTDLQSIISDHKDELGPALKEGEILLEKYGPFSLSLKKHNSPLPTKSTGSNNTMNTNSTKNNSIQSSKNQSNVTRKKRSLKANEKMQPSPNITKKKKLSKSVSKKKKKNLKRVSKKMKQLHSGKSSKGLATKAPNDGNYLLLVEVKPAHDEGKRPYSVEVEVKMKSATGYLSAAEWPLLPFFGAMSLLYLAYGVVWLIVSACQWRELLRIQFWIGGVIALGMLEKAIFFSEYNNVNINGVPAHGLVVFAQVLSCIKRTLSRILIIIVSMGFGIVKPRLGEALQRVLAVGCLYFILCVIEGAYRAASITADVNKKVLLAAVPLSVLDAVICWWVFMALMQTMRTLRIRKNVVKLTIYRHFINILVVSIIASVAFMIWAIKYHHLNSCIKDWKELWIDEAFWHFLFAIVLLSIMILWRPTASNQRYAFTPLIDVGDEDDDDMTLSDAFHGMKMRGKSDSGDGTGSRAEKMRAKQEDDLKWVEENIPTAGGIDTVLPSLLDSDEEVMTTKLEMSKME